MKIKKIKKIKNVNVHARNNKICSRTVPAEARTMSAVVSLLIEICALTDAADASWADDIKMSSCKLLQHVLSQTCPLHSFALHDSRREDCVSICLGMAHVASKADGSLEITRTLRAKIQSLTSRCMCMALQANSRAALRGAVHENVARQSLVQQLQ